MDRYIGSLLVFYFSFHIRNMGKSNYCIWLKAGKFLYSCLVNNIKSSCKNNGNGSVGGYFLAGRNKLEINKYLNY